MVRSQARSGLSRAPFGLAALALGVGVWAGPLLQVPPVQAATGCVALALVAGVAAWRGHGPAAAGGLLAGVVLLGVGLASPPASQDLPQQVHVMGRVTSRSGHTAQVRTRQGTVLLSFPDTAPRRGTELAAWASPARPEAVLPGAFSYSRRHRLAQRPQLRVRAWIPLGVAPRSASFRRFASLPHGGLLFALASGDRSEVAPHTNALLTRTGTRHLLAISGLHVGLVAALAMGLTEGVVGPLRLFGWVRLARLVAAAGAVGAAVLYAEAVGWSVSTQRATAMVAVAALGRVLYRDSHPANLLGLAAVVVLMGDPGQVRSPGFLLSFGAVVGMLTITPGLLRWVPPDLPQPVVWLARGAAATVGAQLGTLPITAWLFQELAPMGILANLVAGPLLGAVSVPGALLGLHLPESPTGEGLAEVVLWAANGAAELALSMLECLDTPPWRPAVGPAGAVALAAVLAIRRRPGVGVLLVGLALGVRPRVSPDDLVVTFLSVGQGDASLVEFPDGRRWLIDGGPRPRAVLFWLRRRGVRHLDAVVLSHPHPDHGAGLQAVLEELTVGELWVSRPPERGEEAFLTLWRTAFSRGVPVRGPADPPGPGISVLHPQPGFVAPKRGRVNEESLVLSVEHGETRFLFPGDIEGSGEAALAPRLSQTAVVKVPHHGSRTSSSRAFAEAVQASLVVVSCGKDSRFGHPHAEALAAWRGAALVRTDRDGTVEVRSDGRQLALRSWTPGAGWRGLVRRAWRPRPPAP